MPNHPIDNHVGARIKLRRQFLGLSQTELGDKLELTFQQVQKYEKGSNRVSASKLHTIARVLDVPISFFFDGLDDAAPPAMPVAMTPSAIEAARLIGQIEEPVTRGQILGVMRAVIANQRSDELVDAAVTARSVLYCHGLFDMSERMAFDQLTAALGDQAVETPAMRNARGGRDVTIVAEGPECATAAVTVFHASVGAR